MLLESGESVAPYLGPAAGVTTSVLWTFTALFFTAAGKRIGATVVNAARIGFAVVLLGLTHRFLAGQWLPDALPRQVLYLAGSGLVGLTIGDLALFTAFVYIGPRLAMLIMTTAPIFAAIFGWFFLGETLTLLTIVGVALTISGVAWVVLERPAQTQTPSASFLRSRGILLAFIAAGCQAAGLLLSKQGIGHGWLPRADHMDPQAATLLRMIFAGATVLPTVWWYRARMRARPATEHLPLTPTRRRSGYAFTFCGAVVGPYLGVWMSLVASDLTKLGIAQTTMSLTPILILPAVIWIHREPVSPRAILGAIIAVAGVSLLFLPQSAG